MLYNQKSFNKRLRPPPINKVTQERIIPAPLGSLLAVKTLRSFDQERLLKHVEIEDSELVASYNLLNGVFPTIFVPGRPPVWTPLPAHAKIKPDNGQYYRDENAARFPEHPMEPAVRSILHLDPDFDTSEIRVFACGSTLGNLLRFSLGKGELFSFAVHKVGQTAFFTRRNVTPTERIDKVVGFGHSFLEANTTWSPDVIGSASHQRVIRYQLGGIPLLVRFESDACVLENAEDWEVEAVDDDELVPKAAGWSMRPCTALEPPGEQPATASSDGIAIVQQRGKLMGQSSVVEIKTRSSWKPREDTITEQLPRLWIRQIHKFVLATHTKGDFNQTEVEDVSHSVRHWEQISRPVLGILVQMLNDIFENVSTTNGNAMEVRGNGDATLEFRELSDTELKQWKALPNELEQRWSRQHLHTNA